MHIAIVLPPREVFSPEGAGAVAMVARSHARHGRAPAVVIGRSVADPFPEPFVGVTAGWRYSMSVARALRGDPPALVEVHNRPDLALAISRRHKTSLLLHNDPRGMRGARTEAERQRLAGLVQVRAVSGWVAERFGPGATVLANGVEVPPQVCREREPEILFVGRVVADKGADLFVEACARALPRLPAWRARILGADRFGAVTPETPFLRALRPRAAQAGVVLAGWLPHEAVRAAMERASVVVMPGRWPEPFGLVAVEAMAAGAALIYSPRGALPDVVSAAGLAVEPEDVEGLAAAIQVLARNDRVRAALAAAGRTRARLYSTQVMARRLDALRGQALSAWPAEVPVLI